MVNGVVWNTKNTANTIIASENRVKSINRKKKSKKSKHQHDRAYFVHTSKAFT